MIHSNCPRCAGTTKKYGHGRDGRQRFRCSTCNHVFAIGSGRETKTATKRRLILAALLVPGATVRSVSDELRAGKNTVESVARAIELPRCPCGAPAGHRGWCWWRFQRSEKRIDFMERWHEGDNVSSWIAPK